MKDMLVLPRRLQVETFKKYGNFSIMLMLPSPKTVHVSHLK
jgi:hypothetical protein